MKKSLLLLFFSFFFGICYSQTWISFEGNVAKKPQIEVLESNSNSYKVKVKLFGLFDKEIQKSGMIYHKLSFDGCGFLSQAGLPALPTFSQLIGLPRHKKCTAKVVENKWENIDIGKIYPAQKPLRETETEKEFSINKSVYASSSFLPQLIERNEQQIYRGVANHTYTICPFKYYPSTDRLSVLTEFTLVVNFEEIPSIQKDEFIMPSIKKGIFDNYDFLTEESSSLDNSPYDYLIIVGEVPNLLNSNVLNDFCKWKAAKGFKTKVVSTKEIGNTCEKIKSYIKSERVNNIKYVLFVGDNNTIPLYHWMAANEQTPIKSDYWYGCLDNEKDTQADVYIGRFPVNSLDELRNMVSKTICYEKEGNQYGNKCLLVAHKEFAPNKYQGCCERIRKSIYSTPLSFTYAYGSSPKKGGNNATNTMVIEQINQGLNIVNYRGHGSEVDWVPSWGADGVPFSKEQVSQLSGKVFPVIFSIACLNGDISYDQPCLLESFMRYEKGSVAFLGSTEPSWTTANHSFDEIIFKKLLDKGICNFGELNVVSHLANISQGGGEPAISNAFMYICGNDPSLEIWTDKTKAFGEVSVENTASGVRITTQGVYNYRASVLSPKGELLYVKETTTNTLLLNDIQPDYQVVLNKHNFIPCIISDVSNNVLFIQDETIGGNKVIEADIIKVGTNVTSTKPYGDVLFNEGKITLKAKKIQFFPTTKTSKATQLQLILKK